MNARFIEFLKAVSSIEHSIARIKRMEMKAYGLRGADTMVLLEISYHEEGVTAADLSRLCDLDKAAVSRVVRALQEKQFAASDVRSGRKYAAKIRLTEKGRQATEKMEERIDRLVSEASADITSSERIRFYEILNEIADRISMVCEKEDNV